MLDTTKSIISIISTVVLILSMFFAWYLGISFVKKFLEERSKAYEQKLEQEQQQYRDRWKPPPYNGFNSWNEYEHFKRLHMFHGTLSSRTDEDGSSIFYRGKRRHQLWDPKVRTDM